MLLAFAKPNASAQFWCNVDLADPDLDEFTVKGKDVAVAEPTQGMTVDAGTVDFDDSSVPPKLLGAMGEWFTAPNTSDYVAPFRNNNGNYGIVWHAEASLAGAHGTADAALSGTARAHVCFVNTLTKVYRRRQKNNGTWDPCPDNFTGATKLDRFFPYKIITDDGKFLVTGILQAETDGPYIPVHNDYHKGVEMDDHHEVFFMFFPYDNGVGRYYVPLTSQTWKPHGLATRSGSTWTLSSGAAITLGTAVDNPAHPTWSSTLTGSSWPY